MSLFTPILPSCTFLGCAMAPSFSQDCAVVPDTLGVDLYMRSDLDNAIADYREALRLQPDFSEVRGHQRMARG
jgi:hypothetical protein